MILLLGGWSVNVAQGYYEVTQAKAEQAIMNLTLGGAEAVDRNRGSGMAATATV